MSLREQIHPDILHSLETGDYGDLPQDALNPSHLQVRENITLVRHLLEKPKKNQGLEYVFTQGAETVIGVGLHKDEKTPGVLATPYHTIWKPGKTTFKDISKLPVWKAGERAELMTSRLQDSVKKVQVGIHGFLGSRVAVIPWQKRLLDAKNDPGFAAIGITWKGGEGTTIPFQFGQDSFTLEHGVDQTQNAILGVGNELGINQKTWLDMIVAFWGHSFGGELGFRHLLKYGSQFPNIAYGLITPLIMGADRPESEWPDWLLEAAKKDPNLLQNHVQILDNSPAGRLVKVMGTIPNKEIRDATLKLGESLPLPGDNSIVSHLLRYFIGMNGLGGEEVLPVYSHSLKDYDYTVRDVAMLRNAPYIAGNDTMIRLSGSQVRPLAIVAGGNRDKNGGDKVLASSHMLKFVRALATFAGINPTLIFDPASPHHPRIGAINDLINATVPN